ncbi:hypothetical protein [Streptomyces sp. RP5T]|uniref:hypothetical protein n=1 Tax=Streptomyces sp. RP5T TaxID=2490848 RepID=UPI000F654144|nr:hypothetical protein [Streptomyces sp. RP5T]RRR74806.1 hypothetical protein EHS43_34680 [Streptomyces sp. RP5T]
MRTVRPGLGVVTFATSLNAAGEAAAQGGADPLSIVCAQGIDVSTASWAASAPGRSGIRALLDERDDVLLN